MLKYQLSAALNNRCIRQVRTGLLIDRKLPPGPRPTTMRPGVERAGLKGAIRYDTGEVRLSCYPNMGRISWLVREREIRRNLNRKPSIFVYSLFNKIDFCTTITSRRIAYVSLGATIRLATSVLQANGVTCGFRRKNKDGEEEERT